MYNTKSSAYVNKNKQNHALDKIVQAFQDTEKPPSKSRVQLKITRLRNYYRGENNKVEKSKTSGSNLDTVMFSRGIFDSLEFLKDNFVARPAKSNLKDDDSSLNNSSIYISDNPSSAKFVRKIVKGQKSNAEAVMTIAAKALEKISSRYDGSSEKKDKVDEDRNLVEMIYTML